MDIWIFPVLAVKNKTAVNILLHVFWGHIQSFLLGLYLEVKLLDNRISACLALVNIAKQFSTVIMWSHMLWPTSYEQEFQLLHILTSLSLVYIIVAILSGVYSGILPSFNSYFPGE